MRAYRVARHVHLPAQFPVGGVCHERTVAGIVEREHPSVKSLFLRRQGSGLSGRVGQSFELFLVGYVQFVGLVLLQQVLRELQRQHSGLLRQFAQALLSLVIEQGAAAHEAVVTVVKQAFLLGSEFPVVAVHGLDALEKALVQSHVVGVLCQYRLHFLRQCVKLVAGFGAEHVGEHRRHPRQQVVITFLVVVGIYDCVVECRFVGIIDCFLYLFVVTSYSFHESLFKVFQLDFVEGYGVVWSVVRFKKRIYALSCHGCFIHTDVSLDF